MILLCEGCTAPPPEAMIVVYAVMAAPFVIPFLLGGLACLLYQTSTKENHDG